VNLLIRMDVTDSIHAFLLESIDKRTILNSLVLVHRRLDSSAPLVHNDDALNTLMSIDPVPSLLDLVAESSTHI